MYRRGRLPPAAKASADGATPSPSLRPMAASQNLLAGASVASIRYKSSASLVLQDVEVHAGYQAGALLHVEFATRPARRHPPRAPSPEGQTFRERSYASPMFAPRDPCGLGSDAQQ